MDARDRLIQALLEAMNMKRNVVGEFWWNDWDWQFDATDEQGQILNRFMDEDGCLVDPALVADQSATGFLTVEGRCPACGSSYLFLGAGGYVTCSWVDCPDPGAASDVLAACPACGEVGPDCGGCWIVTDPITEGED